MTTIHLKDFGGAEVQSLTQTQIVFAADPLPNLPTNYPFKLSLWRAKTHLFIEDDTRRIITITSPVDGQANTYNYTQEGTYAALASGTYYAFNAATAAELNNLSQQIDLQNKADKDLSNVDSDLTNTEKSTFRGKVGSAGTNTATSSTDGLMSSADKGKLDTIVAEDALQLGTYTYSADQNPNDIVTGQYEIVNVNAPQRRITVRPHASNASDFAARWHTGLKFKIGNDVTITLKEYNGIVPHYYSDTQSYRGYYDIEGTLPSTGTASAWYIPGELVHSSDLATVAKTGNYNDLHGRPSIPMDTDIFDGAWNSTTTYAESRLVTRSGAFYLSKQANNTNHDPATDTDETWWEKIGVGSPDDVISVTKSGDTVTVTDRDNSTTTFSLSEYTNPRFVSLPFRTEDGSNANDAGLTFFIKSDNTQWQTGSSTQIAAVEINDQQYTLSQNPQTDNASYAGWHRFLDDIIKSKGSSIWTFQRIDETNPNTVLTGQVFRLQAENIIKNSDGNYVLQDIVSLVDYSTSGSGYSWQVVGVFAPISAADAIVGQIDWSKLKNVPDRVGTFTAADEKKLDDAVTKQDLEGKEEDRYASYTNGFIGSGYRTGSLCFFTNSSGAPTTATAIRQPDIQDGSGTIAFGKRLRTDRDPNQNFALDDGTQQFNNGDVLYISIWNDKSAHVKVTLTSDATETGSGDAAYRYYTATWDEVNELPDVVDHGDYMQIADYEPTDLDIKIPASDVIGGKDKLNLDGSNATGTTDIAQTSELPVKTATGDYENKSVAHLSEHTRPQTTAPRLISLTWETTLADINDGNSKVGWQNTIDPNTNIGQLKISFPDPVPLVGGGTISIADLRAILNAHHRLDLYSGTTIIKGEITNFLTSFGEYYVNIQNATQSALPTDNLAMTLRLESNIPNRDEIADQAFLDNDPNIAGKGGTETQAWKRGSGETNADWGAVQAGEVGGLSSVATSGAYSDLSGRPTSLFDLHDDVADALSSIGDNDRFLVSAEGETGDPNKYVTGTTLKSFIGSSGITSGTTLPSTPAVGAAFLLTQDHGSNSAGLYICLTAGSWSAVSEATGISELGEITNFGSSWTDIVSGVSDGEYITIAANETAGDRRYESWTGKFSDLSTNENWLVLNPNNGGRFEVRRVASGNKVQIQTQGSVNSSNVARVLALRGQKGETGTSGTDGTDGTDAITTYFIYKKRASTAALPSAPTGGTISSGTLTPPTDWSLAVPSYTPATEVVDISQRTARGDNWVGTVWSTPAQFTGARGVQGEQGIKGDKGDQGQQGNQGQQGTAGTAGTHGAGFVFAFKKRSATDSLPSAPTGGSVSGGVLTAPTNWSNVVPSYSPDTEVVDVSTRAVSGNTLQGSWSTPRQFSGSRGATGASGGATPSNLKTILTGVPTTVSGDNLFLGAQSNIWGGHYQASGSTQPANIDDAQYMLLSTANAKLTATPAKGDTIKLRISTVSSNAAFNGTDVDLVDYISTTKNNGDILLSSGTDSEIHLDITATPSSGTNSNGTYYDISCTVHHIHGTFDNTQNVTVKTNPNAEFLSASKLFGLSDRGFNEALLKNMPDYAADTGSPDKVLTEKDGTITKSYLKDTTETGTYDSGSQSLSGNTTTNDTDAIVMPPINAPGLIVSEDIPNFGTVYKTETTFSSLPIQMIARWNLGVAVRIRKTTTKPTASDDAKNLGTQVVQGDNSNNVATANATETNVPAGTYYFYALSGGTVRTMSQRSVRFGANAQWSRDVSGIISDDDITPEMLDADTTTKKTAFRSRIGAGTSSFSGAYADLTGKPSIPTDTTIFKGAWVSGTTYAVGDIVTRSNTVQLCITANSDATFTQSKWEQLDVGSPTDITNISISGTTVTVTRRNNTTFTQTTQDTTYSTATETTEGIVERATNSEAQTGTDTTRYVTPKQLKDYGGGSGFEANSITGQTAATEEEGDMTLVSTVELQSSKPVYTSSADYADTNDFQGLCSFEYGGTEYVIGFKASSRSMYVKKGAGSFVEKTNALQSANNNVKGADVVISGSTITLITTQSGSSSAYVYTYDLSDDTIDFTSTRSLNSGNNNPQGLAIVKDGNSYALWIGQQGSQKIFVYDTNATLSSVTYNATNSFNSAAYHNHLLEAVGSIVYIVNQGSSTVKAYNTNRTANTSFDFTRNSNNTVAAAMYADSKYIFINDTTDNKFYAYRWKTSTLRKKTVEQDGLEKFSQKDITYKPDAVAGDGDLTFVGAKGGQQKPVYDSSADYSYTHDFVSSFRFTSGSTDYIVGFRYNSRSMFVSTNGGSTWTEKTNQLNSANTRAVGASGNVSSGGTISIITTQVSSSTAYVYTYNISNDTLTFVRTLSLNTGNTVPVGVALVNNVGSLKLWVSDSTDSKVYTYDTDATFSTLTYTSASDFTITVSNFVGVEQVGDLVYGVDVDGNNCQAFNLDGSRAPSFDITLASGQSNVGTLYADGTHIFISDAGDDKFFAYKWHKEFSLVKKKISQSALEAVPNASTTTKGVVERATDTEASTGTDTTRYVTPKQLKDNAGSIPTVENKTSDYTLVASDFNVNKTIAMTGTSDLTFTLPDISGSVAIGSTVTFVNKAASNSDYLTIAANGNDTINGSTDNLRIFSRNGNSITLQATSSTQWTVIAMMPKRSFITSLYDNTDWIDETEDLSDRNIVFMTIQHGSKAPIFFMMRFSYIPTSGIPISNISGYNLEVRRNGTNLQTRKSTSGTLTNVNKTIVIM